MRWTFELCVLSKLVGVPIYDTGGSLLSSDDPKGSEEEKDRSSSKTV